MVYDPFIYSWILFAHFLFSTFVPVFIWNMFQEDPLKKEMGTNFSIHAWEIPWTEEPGGL